MFKVDTSVRSYNNILATKTKIISSHKDQLLTIMGTFFSRSVSRDDTISSLNVLQTKLTGNA
jgi:hypothetical protein